MRRFFWRVFSSKRRLQLLVICFTLLAINTILVYRPHDATNKNRKFTSKHTLDKSEAAILNFKLQPENLAEPKTVSYNEIIPLEVREEVNEIIISQEDEFSDSENDVTTSESTVESDQATFSPYVENPWFSAHTNHSGDPLDLKPEDFEFKKINQCQIRTFNNVTVFSRPEFIHEYLEYRHCFIKHNPNAGHLDLWIKNHLKASTGWRGNIVIDSKFKFQSVPSIPCPSGLSPQLIILSFSNSAQDRFNARETWAKTLSDKVKVIFVLGKDENSDNTILEEAKYHNDIMITNVKADDSALEFKQLIISLSWIYQNCQEARFILKTTSDTYINVAKVLQLVDQEMYAANRMYGELLKRMEPQRDPNSKYGHYTSVSEWPWSHFPPFLKGPSYVISGDVIPRLLMASTVIPVIPMTQVYFTGLAPLMAHLMRIGVAGFFAYYPPQLGSEDPCDYSKYGAIHKITQLEQMKEAVLKAEESVARNLTCPVGPRCLAMIEGKCMMFSKEEKEKRSKNVNKQLTKV